MTFQFLPNSPFSINLAAFQPTPSSQKLQGRIWGGGQAGTSWVLGDQSTRVLQPNLSEILGLALKRLQSDGKQPCLGSSLAHSSRRSPSDGTALLGRPRLTGDTIPVQGASKLRVEPQTNPGSNQAEGGGYPCPRNSSKGGDTALPSQSSQPNGEGTLATHRETVLPRVLLTSQQIHMSALPELPD